MGAESHSDSQPGLEKPSSTPEMSTHDAEAMANAMLLDSPLPNMERTNVEIPEGDRSSKLPEGGEGEKLPEGGNDKHPEMTPTGKLVTPCKKGTFLLLLM